MHANADGEKTTVALTAHEEEMVKRFVSYVVERLERKIASNSEQLTSPTAGTFVSETNSTNALQAAIESETWTIEEDETSIGTFRFSLSDTTDKALAIHFTFAGDAKLNRDYRLRVRDERSAIRGTYPHYRVAIPAHKDHVLVDVIPIEDTLDEQFETLTLQLTAGTGYSIDDSYSEADITIFDEYEAGEESNTESEVVLEEPDTTESPTTTTNQETNKLEALISAQVQQATETGEIGTFRFSLSDTTDKALAIHFTFAGDAKLNRDYRLRVRDERSAIRGSYPHYRVAIPAGKDHVLVDVTAIDDDVSEESETVTLSITERPGYEISASQNEATITIRERLDPGYDIIVIAGQSNAVGYGSEPVYDSWGGVAVDSRIKQIGRLPTSSNMQLLDVGYDANSTTWDGLHHWGRDGDEERFGFGLPFARGYTRIFLQDDREVLIVPAALGATRLDYWLQERYFERDGKEIRLYDDMAERIDTALNQPGENRIVAFLWHQGEADVRLFTRQRSDDPTPDEYTDMLKRFYAKVRTDFKNDSGREYPILMGRLSREWDEPSMPLFDRVQGVVARSLPMTAVVSSTNLATYDGKHFTSESYLALGRRYFKSYVENKLGQ